MIEVGEQLLTQIWLFLSPMILEEYNLESADRLDDRLGDALTRRLNSKYSAVFVGAQSSGKSTFLNALLGYKILPTDGETYDQVNWMILSLRHSHTYNNFSMQDSSSTRFGDPNPLPQGITLHAHS
jgi:septin family protein